MAAQTVEVQNVVVGANGSYTWNFKDGTQMVFESYEEVKAYVESAHANPDLAIKAAMGWYCGREPNGGNVAIVKDKAVTVDLFDNTQVWVR